MPHPTRGRPGAARSSTLGALLFLVAAGNRCVTDHDALAKRAGDAGADAGGAAGKGGTSGFGASQSSGGEAGDGKYHETPGRNVVTFLHGVVDSQRVAFCFARQVDGQAEFVGEPVPEGGLAFAHSFAVETIDGIDFEQDAFATFVLGGDLSLVEGLDCAEAVAEAERLMLEAMPVQPGEGGASGTPATAGAGGEPGATGGNSAEGGAGGVTSAAGAGGVNTFAQEINAGAGGGPSAAMPDPPALLVHELPLLPPTTLSGGYSYLLAAAGCIGGPWHRHAQEDLVCGDGYQGSPTLVPMLVTMSRDDSIRLSLQTLHASRGTGQIDVRVAPPQGSVDLPLYISRDLVQGVIDPRPPESRYSWVEYGVEQSGFAVEVLIDSSVQLAEPWDLVIGRSGLDTIEDGANYVLVVVGARPGIGISEWWNKAAISLVPADP